VNSFGHVGFVAIALKRDREPSSSLRRKSPRYRKAIDPTAILAQLSGICRMIAVGREALIGTARALRFSDGRWRHADPLRIHFRICSNSGGRAGGAKGQYRLSADAAKAILLGKKGTQLIEGRRHILTSLI
jgi:hypothetical protein